MTVAASDVIDVDLDILLVGGGVAGLWTLAKCRQAGLHTVLLESAALGGGQTRYAQGIIHGGTKYALTGKLTASSEAVADMPARWRACYEGHGELDMAGMTLMSDAHYLWSNTSLTSKISGFFASKVMRNRSSEIDQDALPELFKHPDFRGQVYRLDEPVFDTLSMVRALAGHNQGAILAIDAGSLQQKQAGSIEVNATDGIRYRLNYQKRVLIAGEGNQQLMATLGIENTQMQRRPLKMVVMRGHGENSLNDRVYAHCLGASVNPRITITSHFDKHGNIIWYMGGQLAEEGVNKSDQQLLQDTCSELADLIPWLSLAGKELAVLEINRAEIKQAGSSRPDSFSIADDDEGWVAWPTKLALSPALADALVGKMQALQAGPGRPLPSWPSPPEAQFPWDDELSWVSAETLQGSAS